MIKIETTKKKLIFWIVVLLLFLPTVMADFFPADDINLEGVYNVTNGSFIFADFFCFNNGTCFAGKVDNITISAPEADPVVAWELALVVSILGTSFLFVYVATQIGTATENLKRPIFAHFLTGLRLLLIMAALTLPILAIQVNEAIWEVDGINSTKLSVFTTGAYQVALWIPIILVTLILLFLITEAVLSSIDRGKK